MIACPCIYSNLLKYKINRKTQEDTQSKKGECGGSTDLEGLESWVGSVVSIPNFSGWRVF